MARIDEKRLPLPLLATDKQGREEMQLAEVPPGTTAAARGT